MDNWSKTADDFSNTYRKRKWVGNSSSVRWMFIEKSVDLKSIKCFKTAVFSSTIQWIWRAITVILTSASVLHMLRFFIHPRNEAYISAYTACLSLPLHNLPTNAANHCRYSGLHYVRVIALFYLKNGYGVLYTIEISQYLCNLIGVDPLVALSFGMKINNIGLNVLGYFYYYDYTGNWYKCYTGDCV